MPVSNPNAPKNANKAVQRVYDAQTRVIMERAARDIQAQILRLPAGIGGQVRAAQLRLVLAEINQIMIDAWGKGILPTTQRGRKAAAEAAEKATQTMLSVLHAGLPDDVAKAVSDGLRRTAQAGIDAEYARVPRQLSARVYQNAALASGEVQATIRAGLISGLSAKELARNVYQFISPTTPGGASYAAERLARTEINNAFHEQQKKGAERPGVKAAIWNLSGSHKTPDQCNVYAGQDVDNLGPGHYKSGNIPDRPHPNCLCYLTYDTLNNADFEKALKKGEFDDELDRRTKANLDRLGVKDLPKAPATKPKVTVKTKTETPPKKPVVPKNPLHSPVQQRAIDKAKAAAEKKAAAAAQKTIDEAKRIAAANPKLARTPRFTPNPSRSFQMVKDVRQTNPGYRSDPRYGVNCMHVVNSFELRARGFDVKASKLPVGLGGRNVSDALKHWRRVDGSAVTDRTVAFRYTAQEMKDLADQLPEGGRGWVTVIWDAGAGHIFNVEKLNGRLVWNEAQSGRFDIRIADYIAKSRRAGADPVWGFARVDDLIPTDGVLDDFTE